MEKTKVVLPDGRSFDATRIPVRNAQEAWNEYLLDDGSVVRVRLVATEVARVDEMYEPDGTPMYNVKFGPVIVAVIAPESLKKPSTSR